MNPPSTAPKDGRMILAEFTAWPQLVAAMWDNHHKEWVWAMPQTQRLESGDESYFENEDSEHSELKGWIEWPKINNAKEMTRSPRPIFDRDILTRSIFNEKSAEIFRSKSKQIVLRDHETDARVVCYLHPDGRLLLDAVRLPKIQT